MNISTHDIRPRRLLAADIGGTHARFAVAHRDADGEITLQNTKSFKVESHASLADALAAYRSLSGGTLPSMGALAVAAPIRGEEIGFTNSPWRIRPADIPQTLGLERHLLLNDLEAAAHAAAVLPEQDFTPICGPPGQVGSSRAVGVIGVGTGLGIAAFIRSANGIEVLAAEGGHAGFAPVDAFEDALLARLRRQYGRVSTERVAAGMGLRPVMETLAEQHGSKAPGGTDTELWRLALGGTDAFASTALQRYLQCLGSAAGDVSLMYGPAPVVLTGGLSARLAPHFHNSGFAQRFAAKGRYEALMKTVEVKLMTYAEPGLFGAASAYWQGLRP